VFLERWYKAEFPCCICSITRNHLDSPNNVPLSKLTNGNTIRQIHAQNPTALKAMGYYPCHNNVLYDLQYCDPGGLNLSVPPDILHAILLGYFTRLINGFVRLKQNNNDKLFVFSDSFMDEVERDLHSVGRALAQQSDPDLPKTHFPLIGYLPNPKKNEDNGSGKKNAHELRGVLLTLLCFLLLNGKQEILENCIGEDRLAEFVKIMELTLLMEHWLNKEEFTEEELKVFARFVPYYIFTFTETLKWTDGMGMKLIKIHLLHHFSTMIWLFGCAKNFDTFVPEKNHKSKGQGTCKKNQTSIN